MTVLQIVALVVCGAVTLTAVALFVQAINRFVRTFSLGQPESRTDHPAARWGTLFREFLGHTRMARLPVVAVAHWFTMIAFGVLFFTLVMLTISGNPDFVQWLAESLGVQQPPIAALVVLFGISVIVIYRLSLRVSALKDASIALAQRIAILEYQLKSGHEEREESNKS